MPERHYQDSGVTDELIESLAGVYSTAEGDARLILRAEGGVLHGELLDGPPEGFIAYAEPLLDPRAVVIETRAKQVMQALLEGDRSTVEEIAGPQWFFEINQDAGADYLTSPWRDSTGTGLDIETVRFVMVRRVGEYAEHGYSSRNWKYEALFELKYSDGSTMFSGQSWDPERGVPIGLRQDSEGAFRTRSLIFLPQREATWYGFDYANYRTVHLNFVDDANDVSRYTIAERVPIRLEVGGTAFFREGVAPFPSPAPLTELKVDFDSKRDLLHWDYLKNRSDHYAAAEARIGSPVKGRLWLAGRHRESALISPRVQAAHVSARLVIPMGPGPTGIGAFVATDGCAEEQSSATPRGLAAASLEFEGGETILLIGDRREAVETMMTSSDELVVDVEFHTTRRGIQIEAAHKNRVYSALIPSRPSDGLCMGVVSGAGGFVEYLHASN